MDKQVSATLIGVVVGFLLSYGTSYVDHRRRRGSLIDALIVEMDRCVSKAFWILTDNTVGAPLFRLPTETYKVAFPYLLSEAALGGAEELVSRFYDAVGEINRGLDSAHESRSRGSDPELRADFNRNQVKASNLVQPQGQTGECIADDALAAIRRLKRPW